MKNVLSRREFCTLLGLGMAWPLVARPGAGIEPRHFRVRTITTGLNLTDATDFQPTRDAIGFLRNAREAFVREGYEVQTLRMATQPLADYLPDWTSHAALDALRALDQFAIDHDVVLSIGPVITGDEHHEVFAQWAVELIRQTRNISFTCQVASAAGGVHHQAIRTAAEAMHAIARGTPGGEGNFKFSATAFIPAGTPFFPAAWFDRGNSFAIGLESPNLLTHAIQGAENMTQAKQQLTSRMEAALGPVAELAQHLAQQAGWQYLGIDASPAPGLDASIGQAIETLTGAPFGSLSTLAGCAAITDVLKSLSVKTCGYSGLMLPTLEDKVLAQRAIEGRYGVSELLLYSNVCGTGLDVVPLPGDTSVTVLASVIQDVAALATKYQKPLSARLFPVPGKQAGEMVRFDNPYLTDCVVMAVG